MSGVHERERLGEPPTLDRLEQRKDAGEVVVVLGSRVLRLVEKRDLGPGVRDPVGRVGDHAVARQSDPRISAKDPGVAVPRLAHDVEPPEARCPLAHPGLMVLGQRFRGQRVSEPVADRVEVEVGQRALNLGEAARRHGDLEVVVLACLAAAKEIERPARRDVPRRFTSRSRRATSLGCQASHAERSGSNARIACPGQIQRRQRKTAS